MNASEAQVNHNLAELTIFFDRLRAASRADPNPPVDVRKDRLQRLAALVHDNQEAIAQAISQDFGHRSTHESHLLEIFPSLQGLAHARRHLRGWMRPERKSVSIFFRPGSARLIKQPLGVVGVIVPWNYPLYLAIGPMTGAIAAGNRVLVKMSEFTPCFGALFAQLAGRYFAADEVAVVNGGVEVAQAMALKPFDHLLFTGSTSVGHDVMRAAAENLTPVTLELGGKSPTVIAPDFPTDVAAKRIMFGKCLNAGQTCIAPDYVMVHESKADAFLAAAQAAVRAMYPDVAASPDYTAVINDRHYQRLTGYLQDAQARGARATVLGHGGEATKRKFAPIALSNVNDDMRVMQDEIFGPLLPVMTYKNLDETFAYITAHPRPLAMYYFDYDSARTRRVMNDCVAGGMTINDVTLHVAQDNLPFGGVGASGMGSYHGKDGFDTFTKKKGVYLQARFNLLPLLKPPFGKRFGTIVNMMIR